MLRNYIKIAWRSLLKNRVYSFINIFGLALGMSCSLLIGLWVKDELSYNRFLPHLDDIYFVRTNETYEGQTYTGTLTPGPMAATLKREVPEVTYATKVQFPEEMLVKVGEKSTKERGFYATTDFFQVFDYPTLAGSPLMAHSRLDQIIITRKLAEKFFGRTDVLGKRLQFNNTTSYTVGAVLEDIPGHSTFQFDWIINYDVQEEDWKKTWGNNSFMTFVRLDAKSEPAKAEVNMKDIYRRHSSRKEATPILQPMKDVYLYAKYENGKPVGGRIEYVRVFALVAVFILLIACVNFMNLATARSAMRAKEVGVRKVVGALRSSLVGQFMSESVLTSLLAGVLAVGLVSGLLPVFNTVFSKQLSLNLEDPALWLGLLALVLLTGFVSGSYPALFLSALQPIRILKGTLKFGVGAALFRRGLVIFQFTLSIFLIIGILAVGHQMDYIRTKNLGLDRENVLYVPLEGETYNRMEVFRRELIRTPAIASASVTMSLPMNIEATSGDLTWAGKKENVHYDGVSTMSVGYDFLKTMNIKLVDGRDFSSARKADSASYIINEAAAKMMGMENPVGQQVGFWMGKGPIIGVMKDFHLQSLHRPITPLVLTLIPTNTSYLLVRPEKGKTAEAIDEMERITKQFNPDYPFEYHFLDEAYEWMYRSEQQINSLITYFGALAILISCLGLFALAAFTAEQRKKEIGVRKVLGASVGSLVALTSKDFLKLVLVALLLASPLAWWAVSEWLKTFEYRIQLSWQLFVLAGVLAVTIAFLTVSYQSIKAALTNPVTSLRSE